MASYRSVPMAACSQRNLHPPPRRPPRAVPTQKILWRESTEYSPASARCACNRWYHGHPYGAWEGRYRRKLRLTTRANLRSCADPFRSFRFKFAQHSPTTRPSRRKDCRESIYAFGSRLALQRRGSCRGDKGWLCWGV